MSLRLAPVPPRSRLSPFDGQRAEIAEIARSKLRQARNSYRAYDEAYQRMIDLLADWAASFA